MAQGKWKCNECGGGGNEGNCIWCGGTGRPSYQQAFMLGLSCGQEGYMIQHNQSVGDLLRILSDYGSTESLDAAFHGDIKFSTLIKKVKEDSVDAVMTIIHRMRSFGTEADLNAFFDNKVSRLIDEISPLR